ncbi:MAG TPA: hypothetical protein VJ851_00750 [Jatrophihabitans sp.]|nr:hypothetical protein [Jatrophihabitans sp.]
MTSVVVLPRHGGKTFRALEWLAEKPESRVLICASADGAVAAFKQAQRAGCTTLTRQNFMAAGSRWSLHGVGIEYGVDNAEIVLASLLGVAGRVALLTVTGVPA